MKELQLKVEEEAEVCVPVAVNPRWGVLVLP